MARCLIIASKNVYSFFVHPGAIFTQAPPHEAFGPMWKDGFGKDNSFCEIASQRLVNLVVSTSTTSPNVASPPSKRHSHNNSYARIHAVTSKKDTGHS